MSTNSINNTFLSTKGGYVECSLLPRKALQSTISTWASSMSQASLQIALAKVDFPLPWKTIASSDSK